MNKKAARLRKKKEADESWFEANNIPIEDRGCFCAKCRKENEE